MTSIRTISRAVTQSFRHWCHRRRTVQIGPDTIIAGGVVTKPGGGCISIGSGCSLETGVVIETFDGRIELGSRVFLGPYTIIYGHGGVSIGEKTLIAMHCRILSSNHTLAPYGTDICSLPDVKLPTKIGRDVWLGAGVTVLGGVTIGDGCIVGAGAVVTRNLPAGAIAHGVPAQVKGWRDGATPQPNG